MLNNRNILCDELTLIENKSIMSIENYPRLLAAAKEFNLDQNELINILVRNGFNRDDLKQHLN